MINKHLRIHGDNIIECERSLSLLSAAFRKVPRLIASSPVWMPQYLLGTMQVDLLAGHGRWGIDISDILSANGSILREYADSYITEVNDASETILFALEYCSALPAGNNAWQRNGRALSSALVGIPYLYLAEIGGVELDENREVKAPRFPNPVVPFSYLMTSRRLSSFCMPIYTAHPSITEALFQKYSNVFGLNDCLQLIAAIVKGEDYSSVANILRQKALNMVKLLANDRQHEDTLRGEDWSHLLESEDSVRWLQNNTPNLIWAKKTATKVNVTPTFRRLFAEVLSYNCSTIGAKDLPICIIPQSKRSRFDLFLKRLYPPINITFDKSKPLAIVWITGFKPRGDDSRPDRGLTPLAKMMLGNDSQLLAIISGPAKPYTWLEFKESPEILANENGLWQSVLNLCNYVLIDSCTCNEKFFYQIELETSPNCEVISFQYTKPFVSFSEHDTDTIIHQLFSHKKHLNIFENLCNPPGGDWSGISYFANPSEEYRWTSLPRVSQVGGKRPDHVIQIREADNDVFLSIESKLKGKDLETNIGLNLKTYLNDLFESLPTAYRSKQKDWRLFTGTKMKLRPYSIISIGAYEYKNVEEMYLQMKRGQLDAIFAFEFGVPTTLHVLHKANEKKIEEILKQVQLGLNGLKIQVH